jgi:glycosyltransferase involved in cell wall biosynthesis
MSPFEATTPIDVMWPSWARSREIATVVTLYDLIPLIFPDEYLRTPGMRAFYSARVEMIRHVDGILALSQHTARDAVEYLHVSPDRVHVINAGTNENFAAMYPTATAVWEHMSRHLADVRPGFLLYVGGADFRKNLDGMIAGFGRLPSTMRTRHQLVIAGILNPGQADCLRAEADRAGIGADELVLTGHVSDSDLGALYHGCTLFVFPSLYEGFGLPILEAMSCGAPVAGSTTTSVPEVLGDSEGTFDPHDPDSIAASLVSILSSPQVMERLRGRSARRVAYYTWKRVAERSIEAYEGVVTRTKGHRYRRARIAFVTPWPPDQTRIADYNFRLAVELARQVDLDVVVGRAVEEYPDSREFGVGLIYARDFEEIHTLRQYDRVLYSMGDSELHGHAYELLTRHPGAVMLHDVRMADFYRRYADGEPDVDRERAAADRIWAMYGHRLAHDAGQDRMPPPERRAALGIYMTQELQRYAERCFVHSRSAREVLELDRGTSDCPKEVSVLPFGVPPPHYARRRGPGSSPLIVSFGDVSPVRGMATLMTAFALLSADLPAARLVITGRVEPDARRWASGAPIDFVGNVGPEWHEALLSTADLAVQLRLLTDDQAPTLVADCLSHGLPVIVTDLDWAADLPCNVAEKVPSSVSPHQLKDLIARLIADSDRLAGLSRCAVAYARASSFARVADAYLDALGLV